MSNLLLFNEFLIYLAPVVHFLLVFHFFTVHLIITVNQRTFPRCLTILVSIAAQCLQVNRGLLVASYQYLWLSLIHLPESASVLPSLYRVAPPSLFKFGLSIEAIPLLGDMFSLPEATPSSLSLSTTIFDPLGPLTCILEYEVTVSEGV